MKMSSPALELNKIHLRTRRQGQKDKIKRQKGTSVERGENDRRRGEREERKVSSEGKHGDENKMENNNKSKGGGEANVSDKKAHTGKRTRVNKANLKREEEIWYLLWRPREISSFH